MNYLEKSKDQYNVLDYPKWKRLGSFKLAQSVEKTTGVTEISGLNQWRNQQAKIHHITSEDKDLYEIMDVPYGDMIETIDQYKYGTDKKYVAEAKAHFGTGHIINIPDGVIIEEPLIIDYKSTSNKKDIIDNNIVTIGVNASAKIVIRYSSTHDEEAYHNGLTRIFANRDSQLQITFIQNFNDKMTHIHNSVSLIKNNGKVSYQSFDFGGNVIASDYSSFMLEDYAFNETMTAYIGDHNQKLDLGYNSVHIGKATESIIETRGALLGHAKKIFRGNLKFERGASKSSGREEEFVLLLDENVKSDAIPALLCDEDDVSGEHAASAGQVNEQQMFYLMSRGFTEREAKKLIIHGSFSPIIDKIPTEDLKSYVEKELERRLVHA